jgi:CRISPR-associated exonuclease Cas4
VYTRSKNHLLEVPILVSDIAGVKKAALEIRLMLEKNHYPKATKFKKRCDHCTNKNICTQ